MDSLLYHFEKCASTGELETLKAVFNSSKIDTLLRYGLIGFMLVAGINHFINPQFYLPLIPDYLPFPKTINIASGIVEVVFGILLLFKSTRYLAGIGIIILLVLFVPSHIYFINLGACVPDGLCTPPWVAWLRLVIIHPLFMLWAWRVGSTQ